MDYDRVRILVLGDSGVGKTTLMHLLCYEQFVSNPSWTIGCSTYVKVHEYREGKQGSKPYFLELFDIGGSANHSASRGIFYNVVHGIILVHDLSNRKSLTNLRKWLQEAFGHRDVGGGGGIKNSVRDSQSDYDPEQFIGSTNVPVLLVGTKLDQISANKDIPRSKPGFASDIGAESIYLDCGQVKAFLSDQKIQSRLKYYFDKVIDKCYQGSSRALSQLYHDTLSLNYSKIPDRHY